MRRKDNWLTALWRLEWKRSRKDWLRLEYTEILCVVGMCVLFILGRARLDRFVAYTLNMPAAVYAFWGISSGVATGKAAFYIQWLLMPLHVWIGWYWCDRMVRSVWAEEERGSIFYLCNQWYGRRQIIVAKYLWNVIEFIINYGILFIVCAVLAGRGWGMGHLIGLFLKGAAVMLLFVSLSLCYAVLSERKKQSLWADGLIFGTLAAGNLYKVKDLLILLLQGAGRDYAGLYRLTRWMDGLKWISPLSWLNPFTRFGMEETVVQAAACIIIGAGAALLGLLGYRIRKFE